MTSRLSRSTEALPSCAAEVNGSNTVAAGDVQSRRQHSVPLQRLFSSARHRPRSSDVQPPTDGSPSQQDTSHGGRNQRRVRRRPRSMYQLTSPLAPHVRDVTDSQSVSSSQSADASLCTRRHTAQPDATALPSNPPSVATGNTSHVRRRYRAPDVTKPALFSWTTGQNVRVSECQKIAFRQPGDFCNAYVFTQTPLLPGDELVVQIGGTNVNYVGGLTVGLTSCDPAQLCAAQLPDDADKLLDRPEYWVVHKNICSHPKLNDELAFLRTLSGKLQSYTTMSVALKPLIHSGVHQLLH